MLNKVIFGSSFTVMVGVVLLLATSHQGLAIGAVNISYWILFGGVILALFRSGR